MTSDRMAARPSFCHSSRTISPMSYYNLKITPIVSTPPTPPSMTLSARRMSLDDNSDSLSLDSPGYWENEVEELCQALGVGDPEFLLGSDQRGTHTAWGYAVRLQDIYIAPRYWYSWENRHNAKEATAEELVKRIYKDYCSTDEPEAKRKKSSSAKKHSSRTTKRR